MLALALVSLLACSDKSDDTGTPATTDWGERGDCNPVDPSICALPFPSSFYLAEDAGTETGWRVDFGPTSLPVNREGLGIDPWIWNEKDGFSPNTPLMFFFQGASTEGTIGIHDIATYADADVKTVVIDTETGQRVPHFVEREISVDNTGQQLMILRPVHPWRYDAHYVVGVRGLVGDDGAPIVANQGFAGLRDGTTTDDPDLERQREHYDTVIFPALEAQGFAREEVLVAWDFDTVSLENSVGRARWALEDSVERIAPTGGPTYEWFLREEGDCSVEGTNIARTLEGTMFVPMYTEEDEAGTLLTRDADGMPYYNGEAQADFVVRIPCSVAQAAEPAYILQYGHGFFGGYGEAYTGWLSEFANENRFVVFAANWKGMSGDDVDDVILTVLLEPELIARLPERSLQGMVEFNALLTLARGALTQDEALAFENEAGELVNVLDPEQFGYYGISQGSIYGAGYLGLSPQLDRGVLGVGGNPYAMLFTRSNNFKPFFKIFQAKYLDQRDIMLYTQGLMQQVWDLSEGGGYLQSMSQEVPDGYPEKHALLQLAIGDAQVTTLAGHVQARAFGATTVAPQTREIYGVEEREAPFTGSALVEFEYTDLPPEPETPTPTNPDTDPHECPRRSKVAQEQVAHYLRTGEVIHTCEGRCTDVQATCGQ